MKAKSTFRHFFDGFLFRPSLHDNPVNRAHGSCAICSVVAVNENRSLLVVGHNLQKSDDFLFLRMPCFHANVFISEPGVPKLVAIGVESTKIDDRFNSHGLEIPHALSRGLGTPVETVRDLVEVWDACDLGRAGPVSGLTC